MIEQPVQMLLSLDTTGSMHSCIRVACRNIEALTKRLFGEVKDLEIGVIAHGDYCDREVYRMLPLTNNVAEICRFVRGIEANGGGDAPECYELALNLARTQMKWRAGTTKTMLLIGDEEPHKEGYRYGAHTVDIDWRNELGLLLEQQVRVFGVHALASLTRHARYFYEEIAQKTGGQYLTLEQFSMVEDLIVAVLYQQCDTVRLGQYEQEVRDSGRWNRQTDQMFSTLSGRAAEKFESSGGLVPVTAARFQTISIPDGLEKEELSIRKFVEARGIRFATGRGFYELTKTSTVQGNKEVVVQDRRTGDMFTGDAARILIGAAIGSETRVNPKHLGGDVARYRVFIQSNSYNRALQAGTTFLYEVEEWATRRAA